MGKKNKLPDVIVRRVSDNHGCPYIFLPKLFCELNNIFRGEKVLLTFRDSGRIMEVKKVEA
jgi:hypothetical protein